MKLPLLPTTGVGSFPKPDYVTGSKGHLDTSSRRATEAFIRRQETMGFDVLVDGEFYRGDMATDYARALDLPVAGWTRSYGNRYWRKGIVDRPLEPQGPIQVEQFVYAQGLTDRPVKGMLTGPTTLANWNFNTHYKDRINLVLAWAALVRQEALALQQAGARYIQIDEPAVAERPWEADLFREGLRTVTDGLSAYTITHICYGDFPLVYSRMRHLPVDQVDLELACELDLGPRSRLLGMIREDPLTRYKDVAVGVIDVRPYSPVEDADTVARRIYAALEIFAPNDGMLERIWIKPDCGFRTTKDVAIAYAKMDVLMKGVQRVRGYVNGA